MFFETIDRRLIPLSRIHIIHSARKAENQCLVELSEGDSVFIAEREKTRLENLSITTFPAHHGTKILHVDEEKKNITIYEAAVIGWILPPHGPALPVTVDGINDGVDSDEYLPILHPGGSVTQYEEATWPDYESFRRHKGIVDGVIVLNPGDFDLPADGNPHFAGA